METGEIRMREYVDAALWQEPSAQWVCEHVPCYAMPVVRPRFDCEAHNYISFRTNAFPMLMHIHTHSHATTHDLNVGGFMQCFHT